MKPLCELLLSGLHSQLLLDEEQLIGSGPRAGGQTDEDEEDEEK